MAAKTLRELHEDVFGNDKFENKQIEKGHPTKLLVFPRAIEFDDSPDGSDGSAIETLLAWFTLSVLLYIFNNVFTLIDTITYISHLPASNPRFLST